MLRCSNQVSFCTCIIKNRVRLHANSFAKNFLSFKCIAKESCIHFVMSSNLERTFRRFVRNMSADREPVKMIQTPYLLFLGDAHDQLADNILRAPVLNALGDFGGKLVMRIAKKQKIRSSNHGTPPPIS